MLRKLCIATLPLMSVPSCRPGLAASHAEMRARAPNHHTHKHKHIVDMWTHTLSVSR